MTQPSYNDALSFMYKRRDQARVKLALGMHQPGDTLEKSILNGEKVGDGLYSRMERITTHPDVTSNPTALNSSSVACLDFIGAYQEIHRLADIVRAGRSLTPYDHGSFLINYSLLFADMNVFEHMLFEVFSIDSTELIRSSSN